MIHLNNGISFNNIAVIANIKSYSNYTFSCKALSLLKLAIDYLLKRSDVIINYKVNVKGLKNRKKDRNYNVGAIIITKLISFYKTL